MQWYRRVFRETDEGKQLVLICDACDAYEDEYPAALAELKPPAGKIETASMRLPGVAAENYSRLQDLEIMLEHLTNMEDRKRIARHEWYLAHYQRKLTDTVAMKYADVHDDVQDIRSIRYRVSSVRNQFLGISKGLEYMHFQITNLVKLRVVGLDDATF